MKGKITAEYLPDMQKTQTGFYKTKIAKVGVSNIIQYLPIKMKDGTVQHPLANISSYCSLDETFKGINMSRITRTINEVLDNTMKEHKNDGFMGLEAFVKKLAEAHQSPDVYIKAKFKLLMYTQTPMTEIYSQEPINVVIESQYRNGVYKTFLTVETIAMSLCPCSKEMSMLKNNVTADEMRLIKELCFFDDESATTLYNKIMMSGYGAHNQRSHINIKVELLPNQTLWIEDIYKIANIASSCHTRTVLKRPDEKYETEVSYMGGYFDDEKNFIEVPNNGPKFTEDIARDTAQQLDAELDKTINDYVLTVSNEESIHTGNIMAVSVLNAGRELN